MTRTALAASVVLFLGTSTAAKAGDWEAVKRAVARQSTESQSFDFATSLSWWASPEGFPKGEVPGTVIEGDLDQSLDTGLARVVHVHGNVSAALSVAPMTEVVIGGSITESGRLESRGIAKIYVDGDVDGAITAWGMTSLSVGGDYRGKVETGHPSLRVHVAGNFTGTVAPIAGLQPALLVMDIDGDASEATLKAIDKWHYTKLDIAVGSSDLKPGVHPLWPDHDCEAHGGPKRSARLLARVPVPRPGFVAVTGPPKRSTETARGAPIQTPAAP